MGWKWYEITTYKASVGGPDYYGILQLNGPGFYAALGFRKSGPLPNASAPATHGQRFYGYLDFQQMPVMLDILRNESPLRFGWNEANPDDFHLITGDEPVGEGDGVLAGSR
ncbi:hypothetical protein [Rhodovulum strictum]|uniref:Uncharacterized protein n=1 Tax=Rhodovulum strictum TaxID=58314 RepID=A0A844BER1_9RHOB|nr:hypothetical protein [Rhodovulum strictum]MRH19572.1 hypothetical protein [Rhodovulum strictum]